MSSYRVEASFKGRILVLGTGCIAEGFLPVLWRHVELDRERVLLLGPDAHGEALAKRHGVSWHRTQLSPGNFANELDRSLRTGDLLLNLALDVDSLDLLTWCQTNDVLYLDTNLETWPGSARTRHESRELALASRRRGTSTAVIAHGANPGLVTHFIKQVLADSSSSSGSWAAAARQLGLQVVQVSEFDSQEGDRIAQGAFSNTWSARGLTCELMSPTEIGWGRHEAALPTGAALHSTARGLVAQLMEPGRICAVRSWAPSAGEFAGFALAHHEALSLADLLTDGDGRSRPTVMYAVRPCAAAWQAAAALEPSAGTRYHVMKDELNSGGNELGVLLLGTGPGRWYGSRLALQQARRLAPANNATSLQVVAGVLGGLVWLLEHPREGVVEAEEVDYRRVLEVAAPYLGELGGLGTSWQPDAGLCFAHFRAEQIPQSRCASPR